MAQRQATYRAKQQGLSRHGDGVGRTWTAYLPSSGDRDGGSAVVLPEQAGRITAAIRTAENKRLRG